MIRSAFIAILVVLVVGGCSSSSSKSSTAPKTTATTPPTTAAKSDQQIADSIKLQAADLPGTWTTGAPQTQDNSSNAQMSKCLGVPDSTKDQTAYAGSPDFSQGSTDIYSEATVFNAAAVVQSDLAGAQGSNLIGCVTQLAKGVGATNVNVRRAAMPNTANNLPGFHVTGSFEANGTTVYLDEVAIAKGRIEANINTTSPRSVDESLVNAATSALAKELNAAV